MLMIVGSFSSYAQSIEVILPSLQEGAFHNYWWMKDSEKMEHLKNSSLYKQMLEKGLTVDILKHSPDKKIWSKFENGAVKYIFLTDVNNSFDSKFVIQRIKKTVLLYNKKDEVYDKKVTYLVEVFKTWNGYKEVEGRLKKSDTHTGTFYNIGKKKRKVIIKEFETGIGTIKDRAESIEVWPFNPRSLYFGTGYKSNDAVKKMYDSIQFKDFESWTLKVEVTSSGYILESPQLNIFVKQ